MKRLLITAMMCAVAGGVFAQDTKTDSVKNSSDTTKQSSASKWEDYHSKRDSSISYHHRSSYPRPSFGLTFSRFDIGLTTLIDNGTHHGGN